MVERRSDCLAVVKIGRRVGRKESKARDSGDGVRGGSVRKIRCRA